MYALAGQQPTSNSSAASTRSAEVPMKRPFGVAVRCVSMSTTASTMMETTSRSSGCTIGASSWPGHPMHIDAAENDMTTEMERYYTSIEDGEDTEWCLDSLIAETSARWKRQLRDSLRSSSSSHLCSSLRPEESVSSDTPSSPTTASPPPSSSQRMILHQEPDEHEDQKVLQRRILAQQRREIELLRAKLAASGTTAPLSQTEHNCVPPQIVLLPHNGAHHHLDHEMIADDDLTLDL